MGSTATQEIKDKFVTLHNELRRKHINTPDLVWDDELASGAQEWANKLIESGTFKHAGSGENLYKSWSSNDVDINEACEKAVATWYKEINHYDFDNPGYRKGVNHFTQVVWQSSTKLGVGVAKGIANNGFDVIIVARYLPNGNYINQYKDNVMSLK